MAVLASSDRPVAVGDGLLQHVSRQISRLAAEASEGEQPPTDAAMYSCLASFEQLARRNEALGAHPRPLLSTGGGGDILVEWRGNSRNLLVFAMPDGAIHIHRVLLTRDGRLASQTVTSDAAPGDVAAAVMKWLAFGDPGPA